MLLFIILDYVMSESITLQFHGYDVDRVSLESYRVCKRGVCGTYRLLRCASWRNTAVYREWCLCNQSKHSSSGNQFVTFWRRRHYVYRSSGPPSVCPSVRWRLLSHVLSGRIPMTHATNIHHMSGRCWKCFQGQRPRSRSWSDQLTWLVWRDISVLKGSQQN